MDFIPFEKPLLDLEIRLDELRKLATEEPLGLNHELSDLEAKYAQVRQQMFSSLTPYEITQLARHPKRPTSLDIIREVFSGFIELHGDRNFLDDKSIIGGLAKLGTTSVVVLGHQKGRGTKDNIYRNFGMPRPEGYRKALRLMSLAERFGLPIITFIDTPGAYPGVDAEERGQSEAIAKNIFVMCRLKVPIVTIVLGEGGSGGALALAVGNRVHMLAYAIYSVISPEGGASILMKDSGRAADMAEKLKLTAPSALQLKVIDSIIEEPEGGAHKNVAQVVEKIKHLLVQDLQEMASWSGEQLRKHRMEKFLEMGRAFLKS